MDMGSLSSFEESRPYHLKGFEVTRKLVLEGKDGEEPDMLTELGGLLADLDFREGDRLKGGVVVHQDDGAVRMTASVVSQPRPQRG